MLAALAAAVEALAAVALPFGVLVVVALLAWAGLGATAPWFAFVRGAADVWLLGHGVDVRFAAPSVPPFLVSLGVLGPAVGTVLLAARAGRRAALTPSPLAAAGGALVAALAGSAVVLALGTSAVARPSTVQGVLLPAAVVAVGFAAGVLVERGAPARLPVSLVAGLRAAAAAVAVLLTAAALAVAVLLAVHLTDVVGLYESVGAGIAGGLALTALQIVLLPTVVVWAASWLTGAGFALGAGSSVGPLGTFVGPLPSVPLLGALPHHAGAVGLAALLVPVLAGFGCGYAARRRADGASPLVVGLVAGLGAGLLLGALAAAASGAAGPGRLAVVGPEPLRVALLATAEIGLPALLGAAVVRRRPPDAEQESAGEPPR